MEPSADGGHLWGELDTHFKKVRWMFQRRVTEDEVEEVKLKELVDIISLQKATETAGRSIAESQRVMFGAPSDCTRPSNSFMYVIQLTCTKHLTLDFGFHHYLSLLHYMEWLGVVNTASPLRSLLTTNYRASSRSTIRAINSTPLSSVGCTLRRDYAYMERAYPALCDIEITTLPR